MSLVLTALIGFAGLEPEHNRPPYISPKVICDDTQITIARAPELNLGLAVITPDEQFIYLADLASETIIPNYWIHDELSFRAVELYGIDYVDGIPTLIQIFQEPGSYIFYFAENMGTEPENTLSLTRTIEFLGKDHPDCPKFPFE